MMWYQMRPLSRWTMKVYLHLAIGVACNAFFFFWRGCMFCSLQQSTSYCIELATAGIPDDHDVIPVAEIRLRPDGQWRCIHTKRLLMWTWRRLQNPSFFFGGGGGIIFFYSTIIPDVSRIPDEHDVIPDDAIPDSGSIQIQMGTWGCV